MNKIHWIILLLTISASSCKKEIAEPPSLGYSYFPLKQGSELIYKVDSIAWIEFSSEIDTVQYEIREVVESFFTDNEGRETARIVRYKRMTAAEPWTLYKVWSANLTPRTAERYEDNIRYVKLVFPVLENERWNSNAQDTLDAWEFEYDEVHVPASVGALTFDSTLTSTYSDNNLLYTRNYIEQYAAGVGLINKDYTDLLYESTSSAVIKKGFIYTETLISYNH